MNMIHLIDGAMATAVHGTERLKTDPQLNCDDELSSASNAVVNTLNQVIPTFFFHVFAMF